jgi:hypothetical protein
LFGRLLSLQRLVEHARFAAALIPSLGEHVVITSEPVL